MPGQSHDLKTFISLERAVWQALVNGDALADQRLLAADFVGVYPTGFADRADHVAQLANGPSIESFELTDPRLLTINDDTIMLCYLAIYRRTASAQESMYVSSLWCRRRDTWVNVFSQDTPAAG